MLRAPRAQARPLLRELLRLAPGRRFLSLWRECGWYLVGYWVWIKGYASRVRYTRMRHEQAYLLAKGNPPVPPRPDRRRRFLPSLHRRVAD